MSITSIVTTAQPRTSVSSSIGDSAELEGNLTLSDRLKAFKSSQFDPDAYVTSKSQHMNEKVFSFHFTFHKLNFSICLFARTFSINQEQMIIIFLRLIQKWKFGSTVMNHAVAKRKAVLCVIVIDRR